MDGGNFRCGETWLRGTMTLMMTLTATLMLMSTRVGHVYANKARDLLLSRSTDSLLLDQHNVFRQEEKAADIYKLHWNDSVAAAAAKWLEGCDFKHELVGPWGENLFYSSTSDPQGEDEKEVLLSGLEAWHDEKQLWRYSPDACGSACHYTQMVWSKTTSVGCAFKRCPRLHVFGRTVENALYLGCFYYPRGNWVGEYPFKMGRPCSSCGSDSCQDGLCVEVTSYTTYHGNEVRSGSEWRWKYDSPTPNNTNTNTQYREAGHGYDHRRQSHDDNSASLSRHHGGRQVSHETSHHDGRRHDVTRTSQHHAQEQHDVRRVDDGTHYRSSYYSASSQHTVSQHALSHEQGRREGHQVHAGQSRGLDEIQRDLNAYTPSRRVIEPAAPQALYAAPVRQDTDNRHRDDVTNVIRNDVRSEWTTERRHGERSPLDILRAETHWCRDRLPSCRVWARQCTSSKAVFLACPRTCGQCDKEQSDRPASTQTNELPEAAPPQRQAHHTQQRVTQNEHDTRLRHQYQGRHRQEPQPTTTRTPEITSSRNKSNAQRRKNGKGKLTDEERHRRRLQRRLERQQQRQKEKEERRRQREERKRQQREERKRQKEEQRRLKKENRKSSRGENPRTKGENRRLKGEKKREKGDQQRRRRRHRVHPNYRTWDRRAENLAVNMRRQAIGDVCKDDPNYEKSCPFWVERGFCDGNELLNNVYCKHSCGTC